MNTHVSLPSREEILARKMRLGVIANPAQIAARIREKEAAERARRMAEAQARAAEKMRQANMRALAAAMLRQHEDASIMAGEKKPKPFSLREIVVAVAQIHGLTVLDMISHRRTANVVLPRQIAMWAMLRFTERSLPEVGRAVGGRDHTTALHARRKIERLVASGALADPREEIAAVILERRAAL